MLTYQIRPRVFRLESGTEFRFPADCEIRFHLLPMQPFGLSADGGRTIVRAKAAHLLFSANSGEHHACSSEPLSPLDVTIEEPTRTVRLAGRTFSVMRTFKCRKEFDDELIGVYFGLPILLNVAFADPPYVERVECIVGGVKARWELSDFRFTLWPTTQEEQEAAVVKVWNRMGVLSGPDRRRLIAALHYFHLACRLARRGSTPGEFMAEVILNLSKSLEVLFPPTGSGNTREAARKGLRAIGIADDVIEQDLIPAMALRNEIDVAHVELGLFKMEDLKAIHAYTDRAEDAFREMFERLLCLVESDKYVVSRYELKGPRKEVLKIIERLKKANPVE